ncbi:MAG: YidC/Oxa1 family membrane protein insertase [Paenibacillaceae bacterium]|uniref:YidC/Oxa1 family membrane protein insertase n=1 Tax=Paenibacillus mellifer TaxID=2937794 RepID=A0A9X2BRZ8_9BACL|nr:YidC/Oxa1 family membrane protein insertase [Paenibacillus mellifer]MBW4837833.1 YidC/Oxa1 family membrane protein insertase [Paenibacillaceae bacterium]MCK8489993.1 YidC/Oxa1 family membrane protein insertase [Paenibacillus mellifer]
MSRLMTNRRRWLLLLLAVVMVAVLAGCAPQNAHLATTTENMKDSNSWWTANVVYYFSLVLDTFAEWFNGAYGVAILIMVLIVRTLILPLTLKQVKSSKAMQAIQPQLQKIREQYKDNPEQQQQETMKLFQEHKVNPMAGCFPLIIQMPVFIALYNSIYYNSAIREHSFLWLQLGEPDKLFILPAVAALTTFIQTKMMSNVNPQGMQGPMAFMMWVYPILIFVMAYNFAAALPLYWIFSNLYTIAQNFFIYRKKDPALATAAVTSGGGGGSSSGSGNKKRGGSNLKAGHPGKGAKEAKKSK